MPAALSHLWLFLLLVSCGLLTTSCGKAYVNDNLTDPAEARQKLAADKALCKQMADEYMPPTYGIERHEYDPTIEAQATRWVVNMSQADQHDDFYDTCMRNRGWHWANRTERPQP